MSALKDKFVLPALDKEAFDAALAAYRDATQYRITVERKWAHRSEEIRGADPFSSASVERENEMFIAEKMMEWGGDLLKSAALRITRVYGEIVYHDEFDRNTKGDAQTVLAQLREAERLVRAASIRIDI